MSFTMTMLSWSVIKYSAKYEVVGELNHVKEVGVGNTSRGVHCWEIQGSFLGQLIRFPHMTSRKLKKVLICNDFDVELASKFVLWALSFEDEPQQTALPSFMHTEFHISKGVEVVPDVKEFLGHLKSVRYPSHWKGDVFPLKTRHWQSKHSCSPGFTHAWLSLIIPPPMHGLHGPLWPLVTLLFLHFLLRRPGRWHGMGINTYPLKNLKTNYGGTPQFIMWSHPLQWMKA